MRVLLFDIFVPKQSPRCDIVAIEMRCPSEVFDRLFVFSAQRVVIAYIDKCLSMTDDGTLTQDAGDFGPIFVDCKEVMRQARELESIVCEV
jgi:hypothetical protein